MLKTFSAPFSGEQHYKVKATFKKQEVGGQRSLKLSSLGDVQFEM